MTGEFERRTERRFPIQLLVSFWGDAVVGHGTSLDLSQNGCMVKSATDVPTGRYLQVQVALPGSDSPTDVGVAVVRWVSRDTFGLHFLFMTAFDYERLVWFVDTLTVHSLATEQHLDAYDLRRKAS